MKYLFVIQGEGRGHLTQAISLSQMLRRHGHEVVEVLVGKCSNRELPQFFIDKIQTRIMTFNSPVIDYGRKGRKGNMVMTIVKNSSPGKILHWYRSMSIIAHRIEHCEPDVVVNFYDMLMGMTSMMFRVKPPIINIAHQYLIDHPKYESARELMTQRTMLSVMNRFCSLNSFRVLALSLYPLPEYRRGRMVVVPPLLRSEIFDVESSSEGFILGYMLNPAFLDEMVKWKKQHPDVQIHLFWDKKGEPELAEHAPGLWLHRINDQEFIRLMAKCEGYITTAGFESVCEAAYLGKAVMMIPAHIEQQINAADACAAGVGIASDSFDLAKLVGYIPQHQFDKDAFRAWVAQAEELYMKALTDVD